MQLDAADNIWSLDGLQGKITGTRLKKLVSHLLTFINCKHDNWHSM